MRDTASSTRRRLASSRNWKVRKTGSTVPRPNLRVDPPDLTNLSYGRMFELWKQETGSPANDLTFAAIGEPAAASVGSSA